MNPRPLLTLGIPTYARAAQLRAKLEQLLPLVGPDVELLVVDNGSEDGTAEVVAEAARDRANVRSFRNAANLGCDANYLRVLELAGGDWCWLMGDDEPLDLARFAELLARLRGETADTVHLLSPGVSLAADAPTFFRDARAFVLGFYDLAAFQYMSCNLYRVAAARRHLIDGYRVAGLLHAYTAVGFRLMQRGGGLRIYDLPLLPIRPAGSAGAPRWPSVGAHLGAWLTLHNVVPPSLRPAVNRREAAVRARVLGVSALFDLVGARPGGLRPEHVGQMLRLFPLGHYGYAAPVLVARALHHAPGAGAALVELGARLAWGAGGDGRLREMYGAGPEGVRARIREAIARRNARDDAAEASTY